MSFSSLCIAQGIVFFSLFVAAAQAQVPVPEQFTLFDGERVFQADGSRGPFAVSDRAIEAASERVWVDGVLLIRDRDYVVDADRALLTLLRDVVRGVEIVVRFRPASSGDRTCGSASSVPIGGRWWRSADCACVFSAGAR